jgi:hypothetical protein
MTPEPETPAGDRGVFGNLPSERPGVRSPRRDGEKQTGTRKSARAKPAAKAPPSPPRSRPQPPKPGPPPRQPAPDREGPERVGPETEAGRKGIEDVAWAGVTVAAEAATLGVRLFSRALEAVRERR